MFRTLTQGLCVLSPELMWPQRWSWNRSDLCVVLVFRLRFRGETWGSRICSELSPLVLSAWWELAQSQGLQGMETEAHILEGNPVRAQDLGEFSVQVQCFLG